MSGNLEVVEQQRIHGGVGAHVEEVVLGFVDADASALDADSHVLQGLLPLTQGFLGALM